MGRLTILLRTFARRFRLIRAMRMIIPARASEADFENAVLSMIEEGSVAWDVGANIGQYTRRFAKLVGDRGVVVAFEPSPANIAVLPDAGEFNAKLHKVQAALGNFTGKVNMQMGAGDNSPTNRIVETEPTDIGISVQMYRAQDAIRKLKLPRPHVVKIDVEGCEFDCLLGMDSLLDDPQLRALFIEVHFGLLAERGQQFAPLQIEQLLKTKGFLVSWVDPSHIQAVRPRARVA